MKEKQTILKQDEKWNSIKYNNYLNNESFQNKIIMIKSRV